ncbi:K+-transporting ATPase KdpF subunit [Amycolatopsis thermoflava]|uniref:K+-transporting ATPase KdpF subunit n=1 Tax=Amycolatopsis thermoflava TaxID=84480 RepID=A0A3N2GSF5_9PSEU|nr:K+-transporting ATPase KdpF subunit [Amycolatopsis thermoflava]
MSGAGVVANVVGGVLALGLVVYLFIALIKPDRNSGAKRHRQGWRSGDGRA